MNRYFLILVVVAVLVFIIMKKKQLTRIDKIDWLNANVGNASGQWVKMEESEIDAVYKPFAMIKSSAKPDKAEYLKALEILDKYGIKKVILGLDAEQVNKIVNL